jgi:hypothetical protein
MSTTGIQNYLSNVFRQVYTYDTTTALFTPRLELSNIDTYSGNAVSVFTAAVGDAACNVYVGSNAGNPYNFIQSDSNVTAVGFGAGEGISNVSNSVYLGFRAGAGASSANAVIAIGASSIGGGLSNIFIGNGTGTVGSSNIFIGHGIAPVNVSNQIRIGVGSNTALAGDIGLQWVGLGGRLSPLDANTKFDVSGNTRINGALGILMPPGDRTLDVNGNFRVSDASSNVLDFSNGFTRSTGGFASIQGDISGIIGVTTIGAIRRGIIVVSAVDRASSANRAAYTYFAWTTSNLTAMSTAINGDTSMTSSGTNLQISNITSIKRYDYSITYFPLP